MSDLTKTFFFLVIIFCSAPVYAERLELLHARQAELIKLNGREIRRLEGEVRFRQGDAYLNCDHALFDINSNEVTLFNDVEIYDGKHRLMGDKVVYHGHTKTEKAFGNVRLSQQGRRLFADSLVYQQETRKAHAFGNVQIDDLINNAALTGHDVRYDRIADYGLALGSPRIIQQDTSSNDSLIICGRVIEAWGEKEMAVVTDDVEIKQADLTALCNRALFRSDENKIFLYDNPKMLEENSEIKGDSIEVMIEDARFKDGVVRGNAIVTSTDSIYEDILKGKMITIHTEDDSTRTVIVDHQAESVYHIFNEDDKREGVNEINGDRIVMKFSGQKLNYIRVESNPGESHGVFTPANIQKK